MTLRVSLPALATTSHRPSGASARAEACNPVSISDCAGSDGEPGLTATRAVFLYDMLHPFGLAAERLATFALGLAFTAFGVALWQGRVWSRWVAWGALAGGIACVLIALVVPETSVLLFVGQGILTVWMAVAGVVMLVERDA